MKKILGLDLGTNSIGWALIDKDNQKILGMGSRIIPMGTDKSDYEKGIAITKNADRRTARTIRKMGKRYKLRRNKLLFILHELGMCPDQFQFKHKVRNEKGKLTGEYKDGFPAANNLQDLELYPIKKGTLQLDSLQHYELRALALTNTVGLKEFGKIIYQFNQRRGYAGGSNDEDTKKKQEETEENEEGGKRKNYEVITQKVEIISVEKSDRTFKAKGGKNKGEELPYYDVTILIDDEEKECSTALQNLKEKEGKEEELEIRIKRTKAGESIILALPQKTNWRKQMEATEEILKADKLFIGQLLLKDLQQNKWTRIRNRVILRQRYQKEFDAIWKYQYEKNPDFKKIIDDKNKLEKIIAYLYPERDKSKPETHESKKSEKEKFRKEARENGLKYIIKEQVIYYQRPLKPQTDLIRKCQFEKEETVLPVSHPLFQDFRCWDQINRMYITSKVGTYNEKKSKTVYKYDDRYLTNDEKQKIYAKLISQKQIGFNEVAKIVNLKNDKTEYLNGLNVNAKLKGCDTAISIKKILGEHFQTFIEKDKNIIEKIWSAIFNNVGNEYDENSQKVSALISVLKNVTDENTATNLSLQLAQTLNFPRKYANLSEKSIRKILPLMFCQPVDVNSTIHHNFEKIQNAIETGELQEGIEPYMVDYIHNNPDVMETGGMMFAFAASLVYGKHTADNIKPQIANYHDIKYNPNRQLRNPVVEQITNDTMQVVKAIWKQYQINPENLEIRVELARDLKNSAAERDKIYKAQLNNQKANNRIKDRLQQSNIAVTNENILKYKLYEQQKSLSPYSGNPLKFSDFHEYQIDHIIPKSRLFDDSIANKVLVEGYLNEEKGNRTAWEYITQQVTRYKLHSVESYLKNVNDNFYGKKKKNLLLEKIPADFIERQKKDTQYISIAIQAELAKVVGSDNIKTSTGAVTDYLRSHWGLKKLFMKLTESRFKKMELWDWNKESNEPNNEWITNYFDKEKSKHIYEIKNWSKRYDHRHHAIDALVVALTEQTHIQRLSNLNKELQDWLAKHKEEIQLQVKEDETILEAFFNLELKKRDEIQKRIEGFRNFEKPFPDLVEQARNCLQSMIVSHKPKDNLTVQQNEKTKKKELKIRSALHEATFYGKHNGQDTKTISISNLSAKDISKVTDSVLKNEIEAHRKKYESMKESFTGEGLKTFNENRFQRKQPDKLKPPVYKIKIYYNTKEVKESSLQRLYENNDKLSVKTGGNYLFLVMQKTTNIINKKTKEKEEKTERVFDIVSLYDAVQIANDELKSGNEKFKEKIYEQYLQLNKADKVLFSLQQNDLVYLPKDNNDPLLNLSAEHYAKWITDKENKAEINKRIFKVVKFTNRDCFFIPNHYASPISVAKDLSNEQLTKLKNQYGEKKVPKQELNFEEFGSFGTSAKTEVNENFIKELVYKSDYDGATPLKIQDQCIKIKTDWLGNITPA